MIENELRDLLTARAASVPDNPTRLTEVRSRVRTIRRRRSVGAALALVLLAVGGALLASLPGRPDALPPARNVPAPPYFRGEVPHVPGYVYQTSRPFSGATDDLLLGLDNPAPVRRLIVVRCPEAGGLVVRNVAGPSRTVACRSRVDDHFEGAALVEPDEAERLFAQSSAVSNMRYEPSGPGQWTLGVVSAAAPDRLAPRQPGRPSLVEGLDHPDGTASVQFTVPSPPRGSDPPYGFGLTIDCAEGVRLVLTVPGGQLVSLMCDAEHGATDGVLSVAIDKTEMARLGLHVGDRVTLTIRTSGPHPDQWRLYPINQ